MTLLGPPVIVDDAGERIALGGKPLALLAALVLSPGGLRRDQVAQLFWPDVPRARQQQSVRQALWMLRRALSDEAVPGEDPVRVDAAVVTSDVVDLDEAIARGDVDAVALLYHAPLLEEFALSGVPAFEALAEAERGRIAHRVAQAFAAAALRAREGGDSAAAVRYAEQAVAAEPTSPAHHLALVDLLLEARWYDDAAAVLERGLVALEDPEFREDFELRRRRLQQQSLARPAADPLETPDFVGRTRELAQLTGAWRRVTRGVAHSVVISGQEGIGRSRLAAEFASVVEREAGRVVRVRPTPAERELPLAGAATLARQLLRSPGASGISGAAELVLHRLVPSLARSDDAALAALPEAAPLAEALTDLIAAVAYEAPLLILLDDAQWLDAQSWSMLSRVAAQLEAEPIMLLATLRRDDPGAAADRAVRQLLQGPHALRIELGPLDEADVLQWLAGSAAEEQSDAAATLARRVFRATRGNPLFIAETLRAMRDGGLLHWRGHHLALAENAVPETLPLPASIEQLLMRRLQGLSPPALRVATLLAERSTAAPFEELRRASNLGDDAFVAATAELTACGICTVSNGRYSLVHDQLGRAVVQMQRPPRRWGLAAAVGVFALVIAAVGLARTAGDGAPLYGGGVVYMMAGDTLYELRPPQRGGGEWTVAGSPGAVPAARGRAHLARSVREPRVWFVHVDDDPTLSPFPMEWRPDGAHVEYERHDRFDTSFRALHPSGDFVVLERDDPDTPEYDPQLRVLPRGGGDGRTIQPWRGLRATMLSDDGSLLATVIRSRRDSVAVIDPTGALHRAHEFDYVHYIDWCGDGSVLALVDEGPRTLLVRLAADSSVMRVPVDAVPADIACSPDATSAIVAIASAGIARHVIADLRTGSTAPLPLQPPGNVVWWSDSMPPVPLALSLAAAASSISVGGELTVEPRVTYSDGSRRSAPVTLESRAGHVASVLPDGRVVGNRHGTATVVARYGGWFVDSIEVRVEGNAEETLLLHEPFVALDTLRWTIVGSPPPVISEVNGTQVLELRGDGNFTDGISLRERFAAADGLSLEFEFQLTPLDADKWQRLVVMICAAQPGAAAEPHACTHAHGGSFSYPADELARFDPDVAAFILGGVRRTVPLPASAAAGWVPVALQLQPDGHLALAINHQRIAASKLRIPDLQQREVALGVYGAAVGTRLLVRNLRVWRGVRY